MKKKTYVKPVAVGNSANTGLPTALAIGAASAAFAAASVAVGRMVGIDSTMATKLNSSRQIIGESNA